MVTTCIRTVFVLVIPIVYSIIVYVHIEAVCDTVIVVVVNVCVRVAIIDFFPVVYTVTICIIIFMVVNAVIVVVGR